MSKIDIKEYLGYYLGQKFRYRYVDQEPGRWMVWSELTPLRLTKLDDLSIDAIQLALRPLSSITEEEAKTFFRLDETAEILSVDKYDNHISFDYRWISKVVNNADGFSYSGVAIGYNNEKLTTTEFHYLISRGFDVFGLIPAGLAIDSTSNNTDNPPATK